MNVIVISGKARSGKNTIVNYLRSKVGNSAEMMIAKPLKDYAKTFNGWNGEEDTKPRTFLQEVGNYIRFDMNYPSFLIFRCVQDINIMRGYFKTKEEEMSIFISDCRFKDELQYLKTWLGDDIITIRVERPNFDNGLTKKQQAHITETDLDNWNVWDYKIVNDGSLEDLEGKLEEVVKRLTKHIK